MPYGLIPLGASIIPPACICSRAAGWSKVLVVGLLLVSLACYFGFLPFPLFGLLLRVALCLFILVVFESTNPEMKAADLIANRSAFATALASLSGLNR